MIDWIRIAIASAIAAAVLAAGVALREHWIGEGEDRIQALWDKQKKADVDSALKNLRKAAADQAIRDREAERTADEDHHREQVRAARLAAAQRTADGLRDAIAKLNADDLSAAAADPRVAAVAQRATAARELLGGCAARYTSLAGRADRLRDQVAGLRTFALNVCRAGVEENQPGGPALSAEESTKEVSP